MQRVVPGILTDERQVFEQQLSLCQAFPQLALIQVDIIDGLFADNLTLGALDLLGFDFGQLQVDLHLMVEEPMDSVLALEGVKDLLPIRAVIGQIEKMSSQADFLQEVGRLGFTTGLSVDHFTEIDELDPALLDRVQVLQIMGVEAGAQGQALGLARVQAQMKKVRLIKESHPSLELMIDGGIKAGNISQVSALGFERMVVGSGIWGQRDPVAAYQQLSDLLD